MSDQIGLLTEEVQRIPLEKIVPHPDNRRVGGFDPVKLEQLAASIRDVGVQQPIIVRQHPTNGGYELVAGERRWRAAKIAGLTEIPAIVRELDDLQVLKVQTVENLQREDVHPLDEADGFARLIEKAGYEVNQVAQELGKSPSYVYQRLKLLDLIPAARKLLVDGGMTAGHAILVARLGTEQQKETIEECFGGWRAQDGQEMSVRELDMWIRRKVLMDLSKVTWKLDDGELVPAAGSCKLCPKRTGFQPALFADVCNGGKKDYCLDHTCFTAKLDAMVARREKELDGRPVIRIAEYGRALAGTVPPYQVEQCKKTYPGAVRTLLVDGPDRGKLGWAKPWESRAQSQAAAADPAEREKLRKERAKKILENKIRRLAHRRVWDQVLEAAAEHPDLKKNLLPLPVLQMAAERMLRDDWNARRLLEAEAGHMSPTSEYSELLLWLVRVLAAQALNPDAYDLGDAKTLAKHYKIDVAGIERQVKAELSQEKAKKQTPTKAAGKKSAEKADPDYLDMLERGEDDE